MKESDINIDIRNEYAKSPITITLYPDKASRKFGRLSALYNFVEEEVAFWNRLLEILPTNQIRSYHNHMRTILNRVNKLITSGLNYFQNGNEMLELRRALTQRGEPSFLYGCENHCEEKNDIQLNYIKQTKEKSTSSSRADKENIEDGK